MGRREREGKEGEREGGRGGSLLAYPPVSLGAGVNRYRPVHSSGIERDKSDKK